MTPTTFLPRFHRHRRESPIMAKKSAPKATRKGADHACHFPAEFPVDAASKVVSLLRGEVPATHDLAEAVWVVAGFALGQVIPDNSGDDQGLKGVPAVGLNLAATPGAPSADAIDDAASVLEAAIDAESGGRKAATKGDDDARGAIPWATILQTLLPLILSLFNRKGGPTA